MTAKHTLDVVHTFSLWELHSSFCNEPVFQRAKLNYKVVFINGKSLLVIQKVIPIFIKAIVMDPS